MWVFVGEWLLGCWECCVGWWLGERRGGRTTRAPPQGRQVSKQPLSITNTRRMYACTRVVVHHRMYHPSYARTRGTLSMMAEKMPITVAMILSEGMCACKNVARLC